MPTDACGRMVDYMRVSITDRCNLRCSYCMPDGYSPVVPREELLSFEEIERAVGAALAEGISRVRITGGEPLVRRNAVQLVRRVVALAGADSVALTTNGVLLREHAEALAHAGLARVNISIDSLDEDRYARLTGGALSDALAGVDAVLAAGLSPVKINALATASAAEEAGAFLGLMSRLPVHVRFIEPMPVGPVRHPTDESVQAEEMLESVRAAADRLGLGEPTAAARADSPVGWGPARYYRFPGIQGTVGLISPISRHFCDSCGRLRLTADGRLRPCLFSDDEIDLREILRRDDEQAVRMAIRAAIRARPDGHGLQTGTRRAMSQIGG